ncbi:uncharacterized protein LOC117314661 [Pecten maximus]|uniref:uncharacterized protein LOC117314661 n=1 Tax=Pecten maximus TaxID=6579 RepID=UPI001458C463|nr:uncharacterized protein LOC117314661 [Pecten maximus]
MIGNTVRAAKKLQNYSRSNCINVSVDTYEALKKENSYMMEKLARNEGETSHTYILHGKLKSLATELTSSSGHDGYFQSNTEDVYAMPTEHSVNDVTYEVAESSSKDSS